MTKLHFFRKAHYLVAIAMIAFVSFGMFGCSSDDEDNTPALKTIAGIATDDSRFSILVAALEKTDLVSTLNGTTNYTVFAPTDAAFQAGGLTASDLDAFDAEEIAGLRQILLYHVVSGTVLSTDLAGLPNRTATTASAIDANDIYFSLGSSVVINGSATVTQADVLASNGVIHVINDVLIPATDDIVEVALDDPNFSLLAAAVVKTDLTATLQGDGPFTVFAPTNEYFEDAGFDAAAIENADAATIETLRGILTYHVVSGRVFSSDLTAGNVPTVNGAEVTISLTNGATVNDINISTTDILTTNGVIHIIDGVLVP